MAAALLAGGLVVTGCGGSQTVSSPSAVGPADSAGSAGAAGAAPAGEAAAPGAEGGDAVANAPAGPVAISVQPKAGARDVSPDTAVTVTARNGRLTDVRVVDSKGRELSGSYDAAHAVWRSTDPVRIGTKYEVRARGAGQDQAAQPVLASSTFTTAKVPISDHLEIAAVTPQDGSTVGVAQPLVVGFDRPVKDRKAVQSALNVISDPPVRGAWYWIDDQYVDFRPEKFWPAGTHVTLKTKLAGVKVGDGLAGGSDRTVNFEVGRRQVLVVDVDKHRLRVVRDGRTVRRFEVTTGKEGWETRNGIKVLMEKDRGKDWNNEEIDAEEEYSYHSDYAMRMTNSGEFIHDAPWSKGNIGEANASHGCVGLEPADMKWLFENSIVGDAIIVRGSPRPYHNLINRYADWNIPWARWSSGNA